LPEGLEGLVSRLTGAAAWWLFRFIRLKQDRQDDIQESINGLPVSAWFPQCTCGHKATAKILTRRVVRPQTAEIEQNAPSRSAKLRAIEKNISHGFERATY